MTDKLSAEARTAALASLRGWTYDPVSESITREDKFGDFTEAFGFMTKVAILAEKHDHHPDWSNAYNRVTISLTTHSAGGLTEKDVELAREIDELLG